MKSSKSKLGLRQPDIARSYDRDITCQVCGGPLTGREGKFVLKYFLLMQAIPDVPDMCGFIEYEPSAQPVAGDADHISLAIGAPSTERARMITVNPRPRPPSWWSIAILPF